MTQSEREILDREYKARASVPDFAAEYATYVAASARAVGNLARHADLIYDRASGQTLDLYPAVGGGPLFVWIHGGSGAR